MVETSERSALTEKNARIAIALLENLHGDIDMDLLSPDLEWWAPAQGTMSLQQFLDNRANFHQYMSQPSRLTVDAVTAEGERIAIEARGNGRLKDGRTYANRYHFLIQVKDGKIVRVHEYADTHYATQIFSEILGQA